MALQPRGPAAENSSWIWTSVAFGLLVAAASAWLALSGAPRERARFVDQWREQLSAIADDRHAAIESYISERLDDARLVASFPTVVSRLTATEQPAGDHGEAEGSAVHLTALLGLLAERESYRSAAVVSADGTLIASAGAGTRFDRPWQALARRCIAERAALADLFLNSAGQPRLELVAPVAAAGSPPVGAVALTLDPGNWLYPFLTHQAVISDTGETLLVRRDADDALFLSPLRHDSAPPLTLRRPLSTPGLAASAALRGASSFSEYVDYRATPIYGVTRLVANTPWALAVKVDRSEALAGYRRWLASATLILAASVLAVGGLLWGTWHHQRRLDQAALQASEAQFRAIFETAAIGMAQADPTTGRWVRVNQRMCEITGYSADELLAMRVPEITHPDDRQLDWELFERVVRGEAPKYRLEKRYLRKDGSTAWVNVNMTVIRDASGTPVRTVAAIEDIGERKRAEEERDITVRLLRLLNAEGNLHDLMREVTLLLHDWLGCDAVGIRLRAGDDFPYFETRGFPAEFVQAESSLCLRDAAGGVLRGRDGNPELECMCGSVLSGRFDPAKPFFTARGSFWTNSTTELLATTTAADRQSRTRNRCNGEGYESVALVPMRVGETTLGLLQVNDEREGRFTPERIALLERLADNLAVAVAHRQGEQTLAASEERYRFLFANMLEGYAHCRMLYEGGVPRDFVYLDVNEAFVKLTGLRDVVGKRVSEVIPGLREANPELFEIYGRVASTGEPQRFETFVEPLAMWFSISVYSPAREHFVAVFDVITERKRAEEALRESHARLRRVLEVETVGVMFWDLSTGCLVDANDAFLTLMGYSRDDVEARTLTWQKLTPPEYQELSRAEVQKFMATGRVGPYEKEYLRKDGTRQWFVFAGSSLGDNACVEFCVDISKRKRAEEELRQARDQLEARVKERTAELLAANQELEAFSYSVSHDLRAPLRAIDGFGRMLQEDHAPQLGPEGRRLLTVVRDNTRSMAQLIDDLLAFSRVGRAELHRGRVAMDELVRSVVAEAVGHDGGDHREVRVGPLPDAAGDTALIRQVWVNLVANAVKFTGTREHPVIEVFADRDGELIRYHVRDNGVGFDIAYADKLFGVFQRLHSARDFPGTGVGLALVRRIVGRHGGTTSATGAVDRGAEFCFTLPPAAEEGP